MPLRNHTCNRREEIDSIRRDADLINVIQSVEILTLQSIAKRLN